ncbi:Stressosome protein rsbRB [Listeria grayi]|nr:STAS domain-containing protein [Listeria grayi]STY45311.1 Stressosome protein rsbRB [Listeria grayi]
MINELSSPVIALTEYTSILPLMGYLDTERGTNFADNVLDQCVEKQISCLMIDLSAVTLVNTNLAQKLFTLLDMLHLVGIDTVLSGVRPEIAQTAVQLGIDFDGITIKATLAHAIHDRYAELGYL